MQIFWRCCAGARRMFLYCTQHALAMHERVSGAAVLCAETEREARAALEHLAPHRALCGPRCVVCPPSSGGNRLYRRTKCRQARYLRPVPPAPVPGVELRILDESHTDLVFEHYHMAPGRDYVAERLAAGAMTGAIFGWRAGGLHWHPRGRQHRYAGGPAGLSAARPWLRPGGGSHPPRTEGGRYPLLSGY